jgi:hypothetical protein
MEGVMKQSDLFEKYTDYISDYQDVLIWEFNSKRIQENYNTLTYSMPVEIQLFKGLKKIYDSKNKSIREKKFSIFMGDLGQAFELFGIAITAKVSSKITDIISGCFEDIKGYKTLEYGKIPWVPLIPRYRYENGMVIEYTSESKLAGKLKVEEPESSGLKIMYRMYESAEGFDVKEKYCG